MADTGTTGMATTGTGTADTGTTGTGTQRTEAAGACAETFRDADATTAVSVPRRGRHRRPRPRKALLAAGGLVLAAGVISLVRISPDSGVGGPGTAEAEPRLDPGGGTDRSPADPAASAGTAPTAPPSATSVMGGVSATPTASPLPTDVPTTIPTAVTRTTHGPTHGPTPAHTTPAPATTPPAAPRPDPTPTPEPSHPTTAPAPQPSHGGGLCVPVIGLCVDGLEPSAHQTPPARNHHAIRS